MFKKIIILFVMLVSCREPKNCWCKKDLEMEWYRLVDWREMIVYLSQESNDSLARIHYRQQADSLAARIVQVEYMNNNTANFKQ